MKVKKTILTAIQKDFLNAYKSNPNLKKIFYLTGGTALAEYYLQHRLSEDFDFFSDSEFSHEDVRYFINQTSHLLHPKDLIFEKKNGRDIFNLLFDKEILKVEFVFYPYKNLEAPREFDGILVNTEFDIAVNKIFSVISRNEPKDFVDLYFLLGKFPLVRLLEGVEKKFEMKIDKFTLGTEFYKAKNIKIMPRMIKKLILEDLTDFFKNHSRELGMTIFP